MEKQTFVMEREMKKLIVDFFKDEQGLTMVEYAIAGALVAAVGAAVFTTLGSNVSSQISSLAADVGT
jgi:pilus assembly protein Flp/PilA